MMRGKQAPKRTLADDPKYARPEITKFVNYIMYDGKKAAAQKAVYGAFDLIAEKTKKDPVEVFDAAIKNVSPLLEVKSKRVGGANYQIPMQVRAERRIQLAFRWIVAAARNVKGKSMAERLASEFIAASEEQGEAVKKKQDVQRMAEANRAFAHFAR
ncbi:30S ribosomal protein S7 [Candidatus Uhrbacteria bacterium]|nr:30S ribosomal protein S7 [Candidatus Uhrbacteria bacterium]MBD3284133.1 30S ribosomal protein S7 [Candidatus Uhrbacteria bacterium]